MAELSISGSVGAALASNLPADVRTVQSLLQGVQPPLSAPVPSTGSMDAATIKAIREFQRRDGWRTRCSQATCGPRRM
jgi:hypothetical protein